MATTAIAHPPADIYTPIPDSIQHLQRYCQTHIFQPIEKFHSRIVQWEKAQTDYFVKLQQNHERSLTRYESEIDELNRLIQKQRIEKKELSNQLSQDSRRITKLKENLSGIEEQLESIPEILRQLRWKKDNAEMELKEMTQWFEKEQRDREKELLSHSKGLPCYQKHTGMYFKMKEIGSKRFAKISFNLIEKGNEDRRFSFCIRYDQPTRCYEVAECIPLVGFHDALLALNQDNNLRRFVVHMRERFVQSTNNSFL